MQIEHVSYKNQQMKFEWKNILMREIKRKIKKNTNNNFLLSKLKQN